MKPTYQIIDGILKVVNDASLGIIYTSEPVEKRNWLVQRFGKIKKKTIPRGPGPLWFGGPIPPWTIQEGKVKKGGRNNPPQGPRPPARRRPAGVNHVQHGGSFNSWPSQPRLDTKPQGSRSWRDK